MVKRESETIETNCNTRKSPRSRQFLLFTAAILSTPYHARILCARMALSALGSSNTLPPGRGGRRLAARNTADKGPRENDREKLKRRGRDVEEVRAVFLTIDTLGSSILATIQPLYKYHRESPPIIRFLPSPSPRRSGRACQWRTRHASLFFFFLLVVPFVFRWSVFSCAGRASLRAFCRR